MDRVIFHIDCNGFYASVECMDNPALRDVPMAVAGDPENRSGIILAKNELAKRQGIKTTQTIGAAKQLSPNLVLVSPRHERYDEVSAMLKGIFGEYTDQVESFGLDEAWLDVTGSLGYFGLTPLELADQIRERIKSDMGLTVSVGVSFNKVFAKLGSDMKKPDATTLISRENYRQQVWPLPTDALLYVGKVAKQDLDRHNIKTIGDIARCEEAYLTRILGKSGETLWAYANGLDDSAVKHVGEHEEVKSVGNGMTFRRDLHGEDEIKAGVMTLCDEVSTRLREAHLKCRTVQVLIKSPAFKMTSRQASLASPTQLQKEMVDTAMGLIHANWRLDAPIRALTITAMNLTHEDDVSAQLSLFDMGITRQDAERKRQEKIESAMYDIRKKHGTRSISMGYVHNEDIGIE